jgi:membrane protease YdiL (CAAX protease family)
MFLTGAIVRTMTDDVAVLSAFDVSVRILLFFVLVVANAAMLARHWRAFWAAKWRSLGLVVVGLVVIQAVITGLGAVLRPLAGESSGTGGEAAQPELALGLLLFLSLGPTVTALIEDFVFRHTLLLRLPVWSPKAVAAVAILVNALIFGAIHFENFDGQLLLTLSYAGAGVVMNLVYLWTRNIWHVLLMHALNNFLLGGPLIVLFVHLMSAAVGPA